MTKKGYVALAKDLNRRLAVLESLSNLGITQVSVGSVLNMIEDIIKDVAYTLQVDNKRFDRDTFYHACGLDESGKPLFLVNTRKVSDK